MKIAISGSSGTGKTALTNELSKVLNYSIVKEQVRDIIFEKYNNKIPTMLRDFKDFETEILNRKIKLETELKDNFITDRSTADILCYSLIKLNQEFPEYTMQLKEQCVKWLDNYDIIFFIPFGSIPLINDGVRSTNQSYQYMTSMLIFGILMNNCKEKIYVLNFINLKERIDECLKFIGYTKYQGWDTSIAIEAIKQKITLPKIELNRF
jgi:nicotinamide riboside kinase